MPFAQIYMIEGRTAEQKKAVIQKVTQALVDAVDAPAQNVRVWIDPRCDQGELGHCRGQRQEAGAMIELADIRYVRLESAGAW